MMEFVSNVMMVIQCLRIPKLVKPIQIMIEIARILKEPLNALFAILITISQKDIVLSVILIQRNVISVILMILPNVFFVNQDSL